MSDFKLRSDFERGLMIFAYDNPIINYIELAAFCAKRAKYHLNVPVCIVTDNPQKAESYGVFDIIRMIDKLEISNARNYSQSSSSQFYNHNRYWSQVLTPFYETIVIDSDYLVSSPLLNSLWGTKKDFLICQDSLDLKGNKIKTRVDNSNISGVWATIIYFKSTEHTRRLFWLVEYLANRWTYVRSQYKIETSVYRNDYSFAIALHLINGGLDVSLDSLPFPMIMSGDNDWVEGVSEYDDVTINHGGSLITLSGTDVHVLHKQSLIKQIRKLSE
jgi:hypothetical protein